MRTLLFLGFMFILVGCNDGRHLSGSAQQLDNPSRSKPNILILMAEDMSARVGAFGDSVAVTPTLDALAKTSVRYPNTFTTAGVCAPSRTSHITGVHQISIGGQHMRTTSFPNAPYSAIPPANVKAYPELMRHAGYYTFTNNKLDYQFSSVRAGTGPFTIWDYEGGAPDWNKRAEGQPFYGLINLNITHESRMFAEKVKANRAKGLVKVVQPGQVDVPPYYPDTPKVRENIAQHYDNIHEMDKQVGELLAKLKRDGLYDNTIVIWTTDHGDGLPRAKREIYDSGIKVPMIIHWPEKLRAESVVPGSVDERLVSFVDFGPSILTLAGIDVPGYMQGKPTFVEGAEPRQYIYASKDRLDEFPFRERAVRDQRYKYLYNYQANEPGAKHLAYRDQLAMMADLWSLYADGKMNEQQKFWFEPRPQEELYDVQADPHEVNNLAANPDYSTVLVRMRQALKDWQVQVADYSNQPEAEMARQFWPAGKQPVTAEPSIVVIDDNTVQLLSGVPGASLGYRIGNGDWQAYAPESTVTVPAGEVLSAKAVRYGWLASEEVTRNF